jgi:hypothetical protein
VKLSEEEMPATVEQLNEVKTKLTKAIEQTSSPHPPRQQHRTHETRTNDLRGNVTFT